MMLWAKVKLLAACLIAAAVVGGVGAPIALRPLTQEKLAARGTGLPRDFDPFAERWVYASETSAVVYWQAGKEARTAQTAGAGHVEYGETDKYGKRTENFSLPPACEEAPEGVRSMAKPSWSQFHRLTGLKLDRTYYYRMVYVGPDRKELRSEGLTFKTARRAGAVRIPGGLQGTPYTLDKAGGTYVLTQDLAADATAFILSGDDITLDLDGRRVVYGAKEGNRCGGVQVQSKKGGKILNGIVEQGPGRGERVHPVSGGGGLEVSGLTVQYYGKDCQGILFEWGGRDCDIHHNVVYDKGMETTSRHQQLNTIYFSRGGSDSKVHHNIIWRTRQSGISYGGSEAKARQGEAEGRNFEVYNNMIYMGSCMTNSMGISAGGAVRDFKIHNNRIYGRGEMPECIFVGAGAGYGKIYSNYTCSRSTGKTSTEYSATSSLTSGLRVCWGPHHLEVYDNSFNTVSGKTGDFVGNARCIWAACSDPRQPEWKVSGEIDIHDNEITALVDETGAGYARAITVCGNHEASAKGLAFRNNRVTCNRNLVVLSESYGCGSSDVEFTGNTFVKAGSDPGFVFLTCGFWDKHTTGSFFVDSKFEGGASWESVKFEGSAERNFSVGWTLTVHTAPGARVTAADKDGKEVFSGEAGKDGVVRAPLMEYRRTPGGKAIVTPHAVKAAKGGKSASAQVTMDRNRELKLAP